MNKRLLAFVKWIWHETSVPIFIERFLLPGFAATLVLLLLSNPMGFDAKQRIAGTITVIAAAYFLSHTLHKWNEESGKAAPETNTVVEAKTPVPTKVTTHGNNSPAIGNVQGDVSLSYGGDHKAQLDRMENKLEKLVSELGKKATEEKQISIGGNRIGWAIFGLDSKGELFVFRSEISQRDQMDFLTGVRLENKSTADIEIVFPAIRGQVGQLSGALLSPSATGKMVSGLFKVGDTGIQGARFMGPLAVGSLGGVIVGDIRVSCEILGLNEYGVVFLVQFEKTNTEKSFAALLAAEKGVARFHDLYNKRQNTVLLSWLPTESNTNQKAELFSQILDENMKKLGKAKTTSRTSAQTTILDDGSIDARMDQDTVFENGEGREIFGFRRTGAGTVLIGYSIQRRLAKPLKETATAAPAASTSSVSTTGSNSPAIQTGDNSSVTINQPQVPIKEPMVEISYEWDPLRLPLVIQPQTETLVINVRKDRIAEMSIMKGDGASNYLWPKGHLTPMERGVGVIRFTNQGDVSVFNLSVTVLIEMGGSNEPGGVTRSKVEIPPVNVPLGGSEPVIYIINDADTSGHATMPALGKGKIQGNSNTREIPLSYRNRNGLPVPINMIMQRFKSPEPPESK